MKHFLTQLDHSRIEAAIARAESLTSGELRVVIHPKPAPDPVATARALFEKLGMHRTRNRNAVVLVISPKSRTFAIYGDTGVHEKCGDGFWREISAALTEYFKRDDFTGGIVHAVERAGGLLAVHFPRQPDDQNELPDTVIDGTVI